MDASDYIRTVKGRRKFDIVFIDPPYALKAVPQALSALLDADLLKDSSIIVCESEEQDVFENAPALRDKFLTVKSAKYGFAHITILTPYKEDVQ
jgi:16S rRNA G966 N2-methylase RsmD